MKARYQSVKHFEATHKNRLKDFNFDVGSLVLVHNSHYAADIGGKTKPRYLGPMVVLRQTIGSSYLLAELDGSVSRLRYAAFRLAPYHPRDHARMEVTTMTGMEDEELDRLAEDESEEDVEEIDDDDTSSIPP